MKNIYLSVALWLAGTMGALAVQPIITECFTPDFNGKGGTYKFDLGTSLSGYEKKQIAGNIVQYIPRKTVAQGAQEGDVTLTISIDCPENYILTGIFIYNTDTFMNVTPWEDVNLNNIPVSVAPDTYDVLVCMNNLNEQRMSNGIVTMIKELVDITADIALPIDFAEANNHIVINAYNAEGDHFVPDVRTQDAPDYIPTIIEEGNYHSAFYTRYIILKGYGVVHSYVGNSGGDLIIDGVSMGNPERQFDFYISDLSDRYMLAQTRVIEAKDNAFYVIRYIIHGTDVDELNNNPADYKLYEQYFTPTPLSKDNFEYHIGFNTTVIFQGEKLGGWSGFSNYSKIKKGEPVRIYIDAPLSDGTDENALDLLVHSKIEEMNRQGIIGNPVVWHADKQAFEYVNKGHDVYGNYAFQTFPEWLFENAPILEYPGHPRFSYLLDSANPIVLGECAPINAFMAMNYYNDYAQNDMSQLSSCWLGRYGEVLEASDIFTDVCLKYNGETVCDSTVEYLELGFPYMWEQPKGEYELTMLNENVEVDGLQGKSFLQVNYDATKEDWTAPTLQMLQFCNTDGRVTDRFERPADGVLEFAGGDFNYNYYSEYYSGYFDCKEMTVAVSYAPYGTESWQVLPVEEIPDLYLYPAFGYFYRGALDVVNVESETLWYDLKVELTDSTGNKQTQILSPAFKINDVSAVNSVSARDSRVYVAGDVLYLSDVADEVTLYDLAGREVKRATAVQQLSVADLDGVYVVRVLCNNSVQVDKVAIR